MRPRRSIFIFFVRFISLPLLSCQPNYLMMKKTAVTTFFHNSGNFLIRYGLATILIWMGMLKFTHYESDVIRPLAENSPIFSWAFTFVSTGTFSNIIGIIEIATGTLIALRLFSPNLSAIGSVVAIFIFLITLTFIVSTPGVIQDGWVFPFLSGSPGQFLIKDLVLLGAALWSAGEAMEAAHMESRTRTDLKRALFKRSINK